MKPEGKRKHYETFLEAATIVEKYFPEFILEKYGIVTGNYYDFIINDKYLLTIRETSLDRWRILFIKKPTEKIKNSLIGDRYNFVKFEEVLDNVSDELRMKMLFHLDLFL